MYVCGYVCAYLRMRMYACVCACMCVCLCVWISIICMCGVYVCENAGVVPPSPCPAWAEQVWGGGRLGALRSFSDPLLFAGCHSYLLP